jgi:hypothetical protein
MAALTSGSICSGAEDFIDLSRPQNSNVAAMVNKKRLIEP